VKSRISHLLYSEQKQKGLSNGLPEFGKIGLIYSMNIVITCGPSMTPIDQVRRITNFSTGKLGVELCKYFSEQGDNVFCVVSKLRTNQDPIFCKEIFEFETNIELSQQLQKIAKTQQIDAVLHAAALNDFEIEKITDSDGQKLSSAKISSRHEKILLHLVPTPKVINTLRSLFPNSKIIGWKYEVEGNPEQAAEKAFQQIHENKIDASVLNGPVVGSDFIICTSSIEKVMCKNHLILAQSLRDLISNHSFKPNFL
jgi:phosphopantothenoylcysteine synthetase/decarboxylase